MVVPGRMWLGIFPYYNKFTISKIKVTFVPEWGTANYFVAGNGANTNILIPWMYYAYLETDNENVTAAMLQ